ncbi:MAG: AAA family ATPase, partial [Bacilli bacterium]
MKIYIRKILNHDITHEINLKTNIVNDFFDGASSFIVIGKKSNYKGTVTINAITDPRFGGDIRNIIKEEGDVVENDII